MICHRSEKHATGKNVKRLAKDIPDGIMMIPPGPLFTNFIQKEKVYCFSTACITSYLVSEVFNLDFKVPAPGTVFTITQDSLT